MPDRLLIRWMTAEDIPAAVQIERDSFPTPWNAEEFRCCIETGANVVLLAAERNGKLVGYLIYEIGKKNYLLLNLAVAPEHRRTGVGRELMRTLQQKVRAWKNAKQIVANCPETHLGTQLFFRACGLRATGIEHALREENGLSIDGIRFVWPFIRAVNEKDREWVRQVFGTETGDA